MTMDCQNQVQYRFREIFGKVAAAELTATKEAVAERLKISIAQLNRIIRGDSDPSGTQLYLMADYFDIPVDDLYATTNTEQEAAVN